MNVGQHTFWQPGALLCLAAALLIAALPGCMKWDYDDKPEDFEAAPTGLFVLCEGNFQYGNATLSYYDPSAKTVQNEVFMRANGMRLGDVAQSMTIYGGRAWIVVNNSHVIFVVDPDTFREVGRIEDLTSPRFIHFISPEKAYVSQIWDNRIFIVNPQTYSITGHIRVPGMTMESGSTEQMVQQGRYVYCNCWSYNNTIIKIDTATDEVVGSLAVGIQPQSIALDVNGYLWALTDGGYDGSPYGYEAPRLYRIDTESFTIDREFRFRLADAPRDLQLNGRGDELYWVNGDIWRMSVNSQRLPAEPFLPERGTKYYALTVSPLTGEVYVADAIDYQQQGMIYRYSPEGELLDEFYVGINPGAFCWKTAKGGEE